MPRSPAQPQTSDQPHEAKRASLFRNGRNQALRIPRALELPGKEALVWREGSRLIVEPVDRRKGLLEVLAELEPINEPFPDVDATLRPLDDIRL